MRKILSIAAFLALLPVSAPADEAKPTCGKTVEECQKVVDNQARTIAVLQIKTIDYLNELVQAHDALETAAATEKAAQQVQAKH